MTQLALLVLLAPFVGGIILFISLHYLRRRHAQQITTSIAATAVHPPQTRQVWYSRYSFAGAFRHVALFVGRNKYEIRQAAEGGEIKFTFKSYPTSIDASSFSPSTHLELEQGLDASPSDTIGASGPFSLRLGDRQKKLDLNMIGRTTMTDAQILDLCRKADQTFVYDLLQNNCQHFAFTVASALIKEENRTPVWDLLFGNRDEQLSILMRLTALEIENTALFELIMHQNDSSALGGDAGASVSSIGGGFSGGDPSLLQLHHMGLGGHAHHGGYGGYGGHGGHGGHH